MNKELLIEALDSMIQQMADIMDTLRECLDTLNDELEPEEPVAPEFEYDVGDVLDFACVKDGNMEFLTGTVIEIDCHDDEGWYGRVATTTGRKFRVPANLTDTRLGTRIMKVHEQ